MLCESTNPFPSFRVLPRISDVRSFATVLIVFNVKFAAYARTRTYNTKPEKNLDSSRGGCAVVVAVVTCGCDFVQCLLQDMSSKKRNREEEEDVVVLDDDGNEKVKTSSVKGKPPPSKKRQSTEITPEEGCAATPSPPKESKEDETTTLVAVEETHKETKDETPLFPVPGLRMLYIRNEDLMNDETSGVLVTNPTEVSWQWNAKERIMTIAKPSHFHLLNEGNETFHLVVGHMTITIPPGARCVGVDVKRSFVFTTKGVGMRMLFGGGRGGSMRTDEQGVATFHFC